MDIGIVGRLRHVDRRTRLLLRTPYVTTIPRARRVACAVTAIALAGLLFRGQLAQALVTRGDDAFRIGDLPTALRLYGRAMQLDPHSRVAADRLAFFLALRHDPQSARQSIAVASHALTQTNDAALLADRGFAEMQIHQWRAAAADFDVAGRLADDARYDHLAARMFVRAGDVSRARADAKRALAVDPAFGPARRFLRERE
jgi:tetratricopeptide (TPR) repeat protein